MIENVKCPQCDGLMVSRKSAHGVFWGCKAYPKCKGTRNADGEARSDRRHVAANDEPNTFAPSERQRNNDRGRWRNQ